VLDVDADMLGEARRRLARFGDRVSFHEGSFLDPLPPPTQWSLRSRSFTFLRARDEDALYRAIHDALTPVAWSSTSTPP